MMKKKSWANFRRIIELFAQNIVTKLSKYGFGIWDPGSEIRKKPIPDPGSRGQKGTGSRIRNTEIKTINDRSITQVMRRSVPDLDSADLQMELLFNQ
jgi:hypothetical protein